MLSQNLESLGMHEFACAVDVETVRGAPKMYKILRYYSEQTIDLDES